MAAARIAARQFFWLHSIAPRCFCKFSCVCQPVASGEYPMLPFVLMLGPIILRSIGRICIHGTTALGYLPSIWQYCATGAFVFDFFVACVTCDAASSAVRWRASSQMKENCTLVCPPSFGAIHFSCSSLHPSSKALNAFYQHILTARVTLQCSPTFAVRRSYIRTLISSKVASGFLSNPPAALALQTRMEIARPAWQKKFSPFQYRPQRVQVCVRVTCSRTRLLRQPRGHWTQSFTRHTKPFVVRCHNVVLCHSIYITLVEAYVIVCIQEQPLEGPACLFACIAVSL